MVMYPCTILADPEGNAWEFAKAVYEDLKRRNSKWELNEVKVKKFGDGEMKVIIKNNIRRHNCFYIHDSSKLAGEWFLELCLVNETLKNSSAQEIVDVLPYLRFSRQDRKDESRTPISAKMLADVIGKYANRVLTVDVHNAAIQGFYDVPFDSLHSFPTVVEYIKKRHPEILNNLVIMAADVGGGGRAKAFAKKIGVQDIVLGDKTRREAGVVEGIKLIGDVKGKNVLIVEDIIDSGGTLCKSYEELKKNGAEKVYVYAPHGLFTKGTEHLTSCFDLVIVGDTIPKRLNHSKIEIVSFVDLFSETIYRINEGLSLSELFNDHG